MAALAGQNVRVLIGSTQVAGARTDGITIDREHIDITNKDDAGVRKLLDGDLALISVSMNCEGILSGATLIDWSIDPAQVLKNCSLVAEGIGTFAGSFGISNFSIGAEQGPNAATFTATFQSAGAVTFTAASGG